MFLNCYNSVHKAKVKKNIYYLNKKFFKKVKEISFDYAILENSKKDVERKFGDAIRKYVRENYTCFETMIEEEAIRNLYSYKFVFNI